MPSFPSLNFTSLNNEHRKEKDVAQKEIQLKTFTFFLALFRYN